MNSFKRQTNLRVIKASRVGLNFLSGMWANSNKEEELSGWWPRMHPGPSCSSAFKGRSVLKCGENILFVKKKEGRH